MMVMSMQIYTANLGVQLFLFTIAAVTFLRFALPACCMLNVWSVRLGHMTDLSVANPARLWC